MMNFYSKQTNYYLKNLMLLFVFGIAGLTNAKAQTTFAAGEIAITGYQADTPDKISLVFLKAVDAGTTFNVTDNGWIASSNSFRPNEGTKLITITDALPCGTEVLLELGSPAFQAFNDVSLVDGTDVGQITNVSGSLALSSSGDQFFVYQGAVPAGFITGIHMNGSGWDADATSSSTSARPSTLTDGVNSRFITPEIDNAVVDCSALSTTMGDAATLSAAIYTSVWTTNNSTGLTIPSGCTFTCDLCSPPSITCPADNFMLPAGCNPVVPAADTSLVMFTDGCGVVTKLHVGDVTADVGCSRTVTRTYRVTDANGDMDECDQVFTFTFDPEGPTLSAMPGAETVECSAIPPVPTITATDNCPDIADVIFINEFHYDNTGGDTGEFIEVAGTAGFDLSTCQLVLYNGNGGADYNTINLAGTIDNEGAGFGAIDVQLPSNGLQNGSPDGFALVCNGVVIEFLSYEGSFTANGGPADGMTSIDVGVSEPSTTPVGESLQRIGTGCPLGDFTWTGPLVASPGMINAGQTFDLAACPQTNDVPVIFSESFVVGACPQEGVITRTWMATDACGTTTTHMQVITVEDNTAPAFCDAPMDVMVTCEVPEVEMVAAVDNCDFGTVTQAAWINEIHYDNVGGDVGEFIEIAGRAGTDLAGYQLLAYDADAALDAQVVLSGVIPDEGCGFGALAFFVGDLNSQFFENGPSEGRALMQTGVGVIHFISYEGTITAVDGPAMGMTSMNIGVVEGGGTAVGQSLQLTGMGAQSSDFTWAGPAAESPGTLNTDQTIGTPDGLMVTFMETGTADPCTGGVITRTWTATDACGNSDFHIQTITVAPAPMPTITCPADQIVECIEDIVLDPTLAVTTAGCGDIVSVYIKQPIISGGLPGCDGTVYTYIYKAVDECGNSASCEQQFMIQNSVPMVTVPAGATVTCFDEIEVSVDDVTVTGGCDGANTINVLPPVVNGPANCTGTTYTYTYRVRDFCNRIVEVDRVFTISNLVGPIITSIPLDMISECGGGPNLQSFQAESNCGGDDDIEYTVSDPVVIGTPGCSGSRIEYTYTATDACGRVASHVQRITIQNDGPVIDCPETLQIFGCSDGNTNDIIQAWLASVTATGACGESVTVNNNFNGNPGLCIQNGYTNVTFFATDQCGRTRTCVGTIAIIDTDAPIIYQDPQEVLIPCNGVTQDLFDTWLATQGGAEAIDECWGNNISWSTNPANPQLSCDNGPQAIVVEFIATDGCGNSASVTGVFNTKLQPEMITVSGTVHRENTDPVANVQIEIAGGSAGVPDMDYTETSGGYGLPEIEYEDNLMVVPGKNDDPLNGVSTYDLILLQQHILSIVNLDSPYKRIAADINRNGGISTFDLVLLRRLILHVDDEFTNNTSWRFVESDFVFPNEDNPFETAFPEIYMLGGAEEEEADFIGVKIGDLNLDAITNELMEEAEDRTGLDDLTFEVKDQQLNAEETHTIDFTVQNFNQINGFQFTMNFDQELLEIIEMQGAELIGFGNKNYGTAKLDRGALTVSWNHENFVDLKPEEIVFRLVVSAKADVLLSEVLSISSEFTRAEAYQSGDLMNVDLAFEKDGEIFTNETFKLFQNQPNPFKEATMIGFNLPEAGMVSLEVFDVSGRLIYKNKGEYAKGYNQINVDRSDLPNSGILYYHVNTATDADSKKMILID